jgi:hypothetical protein
MYAAYTNTHKHSQSHTSTHTHSISRLESELKSSGDQKRAEQREMRTSWMNVNMN